MKDSDLGKCFCIVFVGRCQQQSGALGLFLPLSLEEKQLAQCGCSLFIPGDGPGLLQGLGGWLIVCELMC